MWYASSLFSKRNRPIWYRVTFYKHFFSYMSICFDTYNGMPTYTKCVRYINYNEHTLCVLYLNHQILKSQFNSHKSASTHSNHLPTYVSIQWRNWHRNNLETIHYFKFPLSDVMATTRIGKKIILLFLYGRKSKVTMLKHILLDCRGIHGIVVYL